LKIQFCGAAGEVTGSCTKITTDTATLLVDCGLFQGNHFTEERNYSAFPFKPDDVDAVILTHAHLDHCGRLPKLVNQGFKGKIYATDATRDLTVLILLDAVHVMKSDQHEQNEAPLYTEEDVMETMERFVAIPYDKSIRVAPGIVVSLHNAGHVLGSSFIEIAADNQSIIFSGDIGNFPVPLLNKPEDLPVANALVLESTYGDKTHENYAEGIELVEQAIRDTVRDRGVLLIPAFSLERTQELLTVIDKALIARRVPEISAYLDGPLGIRVCKVYEKYDDYFNPEIQSLEAKETDHSVLTFPSLTITETSEQSKLINDVNPPKLIIAGSGMMQGGRILHHLKRYLSLPTTRLLVVGHQVEGSLGRRLVDGQKQVTVLGEPVTVQAQVTGTHAFSSHMDQKQLIDWLKTMPHLPQTVFLNHGDSEARTAFAKLLAQQFSIEVKVPEYGEAFTIESA
jgi:metallo-beta-lactamase family protein